MSFTKFGAAAVAASQAMRETAPPCIVQMQKFLREISPPPVSLAQGIVHWTPPHEALDAAKEALSQPGIHGYGPARGSPALVAALRARLRDECGVASCPAEHDVMVTQGANQAYMNILLSLLDGQGGDAAVLFSPYYFNHAMAITMHGGPGALVVGPSHPATFLPDLAWLETTLQRRNHRLGAPEDAAADSDDPVDPTEPPLRPIKVVTVVNPGNPTGVTIPPAALERAAALCRQWGCWLVVDNTYEHFAGGWYGGPEHSLLVGPGVVNLFSFSKAFGLMGWRVGYLLAPNALLLELDKAQDTIAICASSLSQAVALGALSAGRPWVQAQVATLQNGHELVRKALERGLGPGALIGGGSGALYLFAKLPVPAGDAHGPALPLEAPVDDLAVVERLARDFGVCVIPGSACGAPGHIRVCYANLPPDQVSIAAERLERGLLAILGSPVHP